MSRCIWNNEIYITSDFHTSHRIIFRWDIYHPWCTREKDRWKSRNIDNKYKTSLWYYKNQLMKYLRYSIIHPQFSQDHKIRTTKYFLIHPADRERIHSQYNTIIYNISLSFKKRLVYSQQHHSMDSLSRTLFVFIRLGILEYSHNKTIISARYKCDGIFYRSQQRS